jgi:hypothetical protein
MVGTWVAAGGSSRGQKLGSLQSMAQCAAPGSWQRDRGARRIGAIGAGKI